MKYVTSGRSEEMTSASVAVTVYMTVPVFRFSGTLTVSLGPKTGAHSFTG